MKKRKRDYRKEFYKNNKSNDYHKRGRVIHYVRNCKVKDKIKSPDLEDIIMDYICKILLNSFSKNSSLNNSDREGSSTS